MSSSSTAILSEYEKIRAHNIERNNAKLRSLGLISALEERESNASAWKRNHQLSGTTTTSKNSNKDNDNKNSTHHEKKTNNLKRKQNEKSTEQQQQASRKSLRLQGIHVENALSEEVNNTASNNNEALDSIQKERLDRVLECREMRLRATKATTEAGAEAAAKENPTATYEHCLMRVRTMSEKGLLNRIKAIERAQGRHCVIKMAIFKSCLQDEDMWDLANLAAEALERLKALIDVE